MFATVDRSLPPFDAGGNRRHTMFRPLALAIATLLISACATVAEPPGGTTVPPTSSPPSAPPLPRSAEPPPPPVNLSGFPLAYRQGYADGCASAGSAERKDAQRYSADGNYRTGWQDGLALCRRKP